MDSGDVGCSRWQGAWELRTARLHAAAAHRRRAAPRTARRSHPPRVCRRILRAGCCPRSKAAAGLKLRPGPHVLPFPPGWWMLQRRRRWRRAAAAGGPWRWRSAVPRSWDVGPAAGARARAPRLRRAAPRSRPRAAWGEERRQKKAKKKKKEERERERRKEG